MDKIIALACIFGWITIENVAYLLKGKHDLRAVSPYLDYLTKRKKDPLVREICKGIPNTIYRLEGVRPYGLGRFIFSHNKDFLNCLAYHGYRGGSLAFVRKNDLGADAKLGRFYWEFDTGHRDENQFIDQMQKYLPRKGERKQVVYILQHREGKPEGEEKRLQMYFDIAKKLTKKPNVFLGAAYSEFLKNGKLWNFRREEWTPSSKYL